MFDDLTDYLQAGHTPVMPAEILQFLDPQPGQTFLDATIGRGGHASLIAPRLAPNGRVIGLDLDPANIDFVRQHMASSPVAVELIHGSFSDASYLLAQRGVAAVDMLLADLGFASIHVDDPARGFSFQTDGPLDMRLDPTATVTAAELVARADERELASILWRYGEERLSRQIARKIVERRRSSPITTTRQLALLVAEVYGSRARRQRIHPATRSFQALRIAVNDELGRLNALLAQLPRLARPGARVVVVSFHSLEDRAVKQAFRNYASQNRAEILTKKPLRADAPQRDRNPRSRSAKLRALRWIN